MLETGRQGVGLAVTGSSRAGLKPWFVGVHDDCCGHTVAEAVCAGKVVVSVEAWHVVYISELGECFFRVTLKRKLFGPESSGVAGSYLCRFSH